MQLTQLDDVEISIGPYKIEKGYHQRITADPEKKGVDEKDAMYTREVSDYYHFYC